MFQRVNVALFGRFMLENREEYPCQIIDMSPGSAAVIAPCPGKVGEKIIAYLDHIGRIEGTIMRVFEGGFGMTVNATPSKRDKLAAKLTWLANRSELGLPEDRRHERIIPREPMTEVHLEDGRTYRCRIIDMSLSGAAIEMDVKPAMGALLTLGQMQGRVVRHFDEGVAIEFSTVQERDSLMNFFS